ncbi:MAG: HAD family phosphatase [Clostridia bacterium]|nr:HAD family phosphatase [Clostridia bacterium]
MNDKFAVFIDIDDTLLDPNGLNPKNAEAIKKARALGHYIFINTGRAKSWIFPELIKNIRFDGVISGIGTHIEIDGKPIFERLIDQSFVYESAKHFLHTENCLFISGVDKGFVINPLPPFEEWDFIKIDNPEDFNGIYKNERIQKIEMFGKNISEEEKAFLENQLDVYDHGHYIEGTRKGCTKAGAVGIVLDYLGLDKSHSIAIGDSVNDIDMLKSVGTAVAVGNAIDQVKEIADFVSIPCRDGGVAYALEELLLRKNTERK